MREILKKKPADLDWIQKQGLLSVKLAQIFALRSDLIGVEKCRQLQQLYQHAASIPTEDVLLTLNPEHLKVFLMHLRILRKCLWQQRLLAKYIEGN